ncbi:MAG: sensor histidine kinase, partial [Gemmatimonadaceae bacterium]|nr:sensor histidine kinase [Gemmatimonadaceae bacterium]
MNGDGLRLADFISRNTGPILAEWVVFAESCGVAGKELDLVGLRDHALAMLTAVVSDLRTPQTATEQAAKSKGEAAPAANGVETAAEVHGAGRAEDGFSIGEMVSEYRALRASVIRLWVKDDGALKGSDLEDLMRFNEAIDQAIAESITRYTEDLDRSKEMFLAILGHDLRSPLGAVITSSQFMLDTGDLVEPHLTLTTRIARSARRMNQMVEDLLDFTRGRLGSGMPLVRETMDIGQIVRQSVEEMRAARPGSMLQVTTSGALSGEWDSGRISQLLSNLLGNAVQHGADSETIGVSVQGEASEVVVRMHNGGTPIPRADLATLFSP